MRPLAQYQPKIRATKLHNSYLTWQLFFRCFCWDRNSVLKDLQVWSRTLFRKIKEIPAKIWLFTKIGAVNKDIKRKVKFSDSHGHNILRIVITFYFCYYKIFFSPQVQRSVIISNKHVIYELPDELPKDLRLRILGN